MTKEFINFYSKNINKESKLITGVIEFLDGVKIILFLWPFAQINKNIYQ